MIPLFDTHQHLIYPDQARYGWAANVDALSGSFTIQDYQDLTHDLGISGSLFMEVDVDEETMLDETRFIHSVMEVPKNGIRGQIAACRPEKDGFADWVAQARELGAVGFRRILHQIDDGLSTGALFRDNIRKLGDQNISFDMCFRADQLHLACELADHCDNTRLMLDHCGVPDIAGGAFESWRDGMNAIAARENVFCKFSGITAYCGEGADHETAIAPYIDHVLTCFGPDRMVWGSDWPVVNLGAGLRDWIGISRRILSRLSSDEAEKIASKNAFSFYRLD